MCRYFKPREIRISYVVTTLRHRDTTILRVCMYYAVRTAVGNVMPCHAIIMLAFGQYSVDAIPIFTGYLSVYQQYFSYASLQAVSQFPFLTLFPLELYQVYRNPHQRSTPRSLAAFLRFLPHSP